MTEIPDSDSDCYDSKDNGRGITTVADARKHIETELMYLGDSYCNVETPGFNRFLDTSSIVTPRFLLAGISIDLKVEECEEPTESLIGIEAIFPSGEYRPVIQYVFSQGVCSYPDDPTCAYFLLTNSIRRNHLATKHDQNFAYTLIKHMNRKGRMLGEQIVDPLDVNIFRKILGEIYMWPSEL